MKVIISGIALLSVLAVLPAAAQTPQRPASPAEEAQAQMRLNSLACKAVGQDDGGVTCDTAKYLNAKLAKVVALDAPPPTPPKTP